MATRAVYSRIFVHCTHENRGEGESRGEEGEEREWGGNDRVIRVSGGRRGGRGEEGIGGERSREEQVLILL